MRTRRRVEQHKTDLLLALHSEAVQAVLGYPVDVPNQRMHSFAFGSLREL